LLKWCYKGALTIGINTNLRVSDLLLLKVGHEKDLKAGKVRRITLNKTCINDIQSLLASKQYHDDDYLFQSQRRDVLTVPSVHKLVKTWCGEINLKGNYGSHTLKKTFGYQQRVHFGVGLPELMVCFNHSTQKQTLDYLCIQPEEVKNIYMNEL
jgi:integrase